MKKLPRSRAPLEPCRAGSITWHMRCRCSFILADFRCTNIGQLVQPKTWSWVMNAVTEKTLQECDFAARKRITAAACFVAERLNLKPYAVHNPALEDTDANRKYFKYYDQVAHLITVGGAFWFPPWLQLVGGEQGRGARFTLYKVTQEKLTGTSK